MELEFSFDASFIFLGDQADVPYSTTHADLEAQTGLQITRTRARMSRRPHKPSDILKKFEELQPAI